TFAADTTVAGGAVGSDDIDTFALAVFGPIFYIAWDDDRTGSDLLYVASAIPGQPFGPDTVISNSDGGRPRIVGGDDGLTVGVFFDADTGSPDAPEAALTTDAGLSWQGMLEYGDQPTNDVDFVEVAFNSTYRNFVSAWLADTGSPTGATRNRVWVGGFRVQSCTAIGWTDIYNAGESDLGFTFQGFGTDQFAIVGLSLNSGPITIAGQTWDIGPNVAPFGGAGFVAPLSGGAGATILLPNVFAGAGPGSGIPVYFAAIGFDPGTGFTRTTDVFSFDL
ncbi:MAG: hypothetical protein KDB80_14895, partial [Planctomycetes bacterium]|nr:hypothetical protein [Planctomycetota bacterium]